MADDTERDMWHEWYVKADGKEPWTESSVHKSLIKHKDLLLGTDSTPKKVFIPMCGRALEIKWFYELGHFVVGVEGSPKALSTFFSDHDIKHTVEEIKDFKKYKSLDGRLIIYCGDFFSFGRSVENGFDVVWDRGALAAINLLLRQRYCNIMLEEGFLTDNCRYFAEGYEYDETIFSGPPNNLSQSQLEDLMGAKFAISTIDHFLHEKKENDVKFLVTKSGEPLDLFINLYLLVQKNQP